MCLYLQRENVTQVNIWFVLFHHNPRRAKDDISRQVLNDVIFLYSILESCSVHGNHEKFPGSDGLRHSIIVR